MKPEERMVSILIPAYNEAESLDRLYREILQNISFLQGKGRIGDYEIWFVDDGSTDGTEDVILALHEADPKVHMISFRRNFGKSTALQAGFRHVSGELVFTMDADLQDNPEQLGEFVDKIDEGYDLVVGWKRNRLDPLEKRIPSKLFNAATSRLGGFRLHDFDCGFKCFRREVVESLDVYGELHRYIPVLAYRYGFRITEIAVKHRRREHGHSKYGMERYMRGLLDSLTTSFLLRFTDRPMYFFGRIGVICSAVGVAICLFLTVLHAMGQAIGTRPLLSLGVLLIIVGFQSVSIGFVCNLIIDRSFRAAYHERHFKRMV